MHLRGFGSFVVKRRAQKTGRLIAQNRSVIIPAHDVAAFQPAEQFAERMKQRPT